MCASPWCAGTEMAATPGSGAPRWPGSGPPPCRRDGTGPSGFSWPRMSRQQADIMTSEITAIRRSLEPVVERVCELWLRLKGRDGRVTVDWQDVNLQDEESEARAALYRAQARAMEEENEHGDQ